MSPRDLLLALVVIVVWGMNFVVIMVGLHDVPPMLLGALRFMLAAVPAVFFIKRPQVPLRWMLAYGLTISLGQFAFLFTAMKHGMPAGLASLVLQSQAFFTLFFAALFLGERLRAANLLGLVIAACGLAMIGAQTGLGMTLSGFVLTICAASMWALGNIVTRKVGKVNLVGLVVWGSLVPPLPFLALSLLVPVVGLTSASVLLGERLGTLQLGGALLVMLGLGLNVCGSWLFGRLRLARV